MNLLKKASGQYVAKILTPHGKRTIQLGTANYSEAKKIASETGLEKVELLAKAGNVRKDLLAQVVLGRKLSASEAVDEFKTWLSTRCSPKHVSNTCLILAAWLAESKLSSRPVHELEEKHIDRWVNGEGEDKASTRKLKLSAIRKFFDFCSIRNYSINNPAAELRLRYENLSQEQKQTEIRDPFTPAEYELLISSYEMACRGFQRDIEETDRHLREATEKGNHTARLIERREVLQEKLRRHQFFQLACELSWTTGLRLGDICKLEKQSIAKPGVIIHVTEKTATEVRIPIKPALQGRLRKLASQSPNQFIFPQEAEGYSDISKRSSFSKEFERFLKQKAGIENRSFHCLRHAYATNAMKKTVPLTVTQKRLGHTSQHTTQKYTH